MTFLDMLKQHQIAEDLTDEAFAECLGVSRQCWGDTRRGTIKVGKVVIRGAVKAFPGVVVAYLFFRNIVDAAERRN